jgi:anaphase-promoting complex subunit 2
LLAPPETDPDDEEQEQVRPKWDPNVHSTIWKNFEILGLIDRYESIIASVGYEYIEEHVLKTCTGEWAKPMLEDLRVWMSDKVVPWMLHVYARGASNRT